MLLFPVERFYPNYRTKLFGGDDIKGLDVYTSTTAWKVGVVKDALVDVNGFFRYLVIELNFGEFSKKVLVPFASSLVDYNERRVYVHQRNPEKIKALPEYTYVEQIDQNFQRQVKSVFSSPVSIA